MEEDDFSYESDDDGSEDSAYYHTDGLGVEDDDSVDHVDQPVLYVPGGGHRYNPPVRIGRMVIETDHDLMLCLEEAREEFLLYWPADGGEEWWEMTLEDLHPDMPPDEKDAGSEYLAKVIGVVDQPYTPKKLAAKIGIVEPVTEAVEIPQFKVAVSKFQNLLQSLPLDDNLSSELHDTVEVPPAPEADPSVRLSTGVTPPLAPLAPSSGLPAYLILTSAQCSKKRRMLSKDRVLWSQRLGPLIGDTLRDGAFQALSNKTDVSRSDHRPKGGEVQLMFSNGSTVNIGSHGHDLPRSKRWPLDWSQSDYALSEFYSAPGGEGLACATPSHNLHQIISALLADALAKANSQVVVEAMGVDIVIGKSWLFDITTTAGIWSKPIDGMTVKGMTEKVPISAISKYDVASCLIQHPEPRVQRLVALSVAVCLAVEHPTYYGKDEQNCEPDLLLQRQVFSRIASLSVRAMGDLKQACYEAAVLESVEQIRGQSPHERGQAYKEKAGIVLQRLQSLRPRTRVAIPPYPCADITPLPSGSWSVTIGRSTFGVCNPSGVDYVIPQPTDVLDNDRFIKTFPASGIVSHLDARSIAAILNSKPIRIRGDTHDGPSIPPQTIGEELTLWQAASALYRHSAIAQYAEVLADVCRAVDESPMTKPGRWAHKVIYKGKVAVWFRFRDPPNGVQGYRVDWFAVSSFPCLGSIELETSESVIVHLWPRQRLRSQEMDHAAALPRRLKITAAAMLDKVKATGLRGNDLMMAWQRLAVVATSGTWGSGKTFVACRHLSSSLSAPSAPFHEMAAKLPPHATLACYIFYGQLESALERWAVRDQYMSQCALLGLPRAFSQLEAYWYLWLPSKIADVAKHTTDCVLGLFDEYKALSASFNHRVADLQAQLDLISRSELCLTDLRASIRQSCSLDTGGKFGWSFVGSLASAHALSLQANPSIFESKFCRGVRSRTLISHLTVRHSARITHSGELVKGTVAECILGDGVDDYLSTIEPCFRFHFGRASYFMNHAKDGELKDREISIAEPKARIMLNDAEYICGAYGKNTGVDMLKRSDKDQFFYRKSAEAMVSGGAIQSSDASRYAAMMSNYAIAIGLYGLGHSDGSLHIKSAGLTYARLAHRQMLVPLSIIPTLQKRIMEGHEDAAEARDLLIWLRGQAVCVRSEETEYCAYTTACHMGQGMSHHSSSLLHAGGLLISVEAARRCKYSVSGKELVLEAQTLVTSDDSTITVSVVDNPEVKTTRAERQRASRMFLSSQRHARKIALRSVSVLPNLSKEKVSGVSGEFNCNDNGIGYACPILGFREMIANLERPSAPSLVGDYLDSYARGRSCALAGQGTAIGNLVHMMGIDGIEQRWKLTFAEKKALAQTSVLPRQLISGAGGKDILSGPVSHLPLETRTRLLAMSVKANAESLDLDPHTRDAVYSPLMVIKVAMQRQHRSCISVIKKRVKALEELGLKHQARCLDESLRATIASARSRGLGRVSTKVRTKYVKPRDYLGNVFQKAPMLESTLTWIVHVDQTLSTMQPSVEIEAAANALCGRIALSRPGPYAFPGAITRRRFSPPVHEKPCFVSNSYGLTPFGCHAVQRSHALVVDTLTSAHREEVQRHYALVSHRKFGEHVLYGGSYVFSWMNQRASALAPVEDGDSLAATDTSEVRWGDVDSPEALAILKMLDAKYGKPVLQLIWAYGSKAMWHSIYYGKSFTVHHTTSDVDDPQLTHIFYKIPNGVDVILALQGFAPQKQWTGTGPTAEEIRAYQLSPAQDEVNQFIDSVIAENEWSRRLIAPTVAARLDIDGRDTVVYYTVSIHNRAWKPKGIPIAAVPYARGRIVTEMAMGGYWYRSLKGVAFRAFLRGQYAVNNIWTGSVLGWRMSAGNEPNYMRGEELGDAVQSVTVLGGIDKDNTLSGMNVSPNVSNDQMLVWNNTRDTVDELHDVPYTMVDAVLAANGGTRFPFGNSANATFIDYMIPPPVANKQMSKEEGIAAIKEYVRSWGTQFF